MKIVNCWFILLMFRNPFYSWSGADGCCSATCCVSIDIVVYEDMLEKPNMLKSTDLTETLGTRPLPPANTFSGYSEDANGC